jgi:hypothetical protein
MSTHYVQLRIVPSLNVECKFWLQDDDWNGNAEELSITVRASSFEQAKNDMESALGKYIEALLHSRSKTGQGQAA